MLKQNHDNNEKLSSLIDPVNKKWDLSKLRATLPTQMAICVVRVPISYFGVHDRFVWAHARNESYSVRSGYHIA